MDNGHSPLGGWIKSRREARGWSQSRLSIKMATHPHVTSISDWERGEYPPGARHLLELGRVFGERPPADSEDDEEAALSGEDLLQVLAHALAPHLNKGAIA